jgi:hypothetical protein
MIESSKGLVHQQNARVVGKGSRQGSSLLHAARELLGEMMLKACQPDLFYELSGDFDALRAQ